MVNTEAEDFRPDHKLVVCTRTSIDVRRGLSRGWLALANIDKGEFKVEVQSPPAGNICDVQALGLGTVMVRLIIKTLHSPS